MVYHVPLPNDRIGIVDPTWDSPSPGSYFGYVLEKPPGTLHTQHSYFLPGQETAYHESANDTFNLPVFRSMEGEAPGMIAPGRIGVIMQIPEFETRLIEDILIRAMVRNPATSRGVWNDASILTDSGSPGHDIVTIAKDLPRIVSGEVAPRVFQWPNLRNPGGGGKAKAKANLSSHLGQRREAPKPKPKAKTRAKHDDDATSHMSAFLRATMKKSALGAGADSAPESPSGGGRTKKAAPKPLLHLDNPQEIEAARGRPMASQKPLKDAKGYYKTLGVKLRPEYLSYLHEARVNKEIQAKYHELARKYHPDRAGGQTRMAQVNPAYEAVETREYKLSSDC